MAMRDRSLDALKVLKRHCMAAACISLALVVPSPVMASDKDVCLDAHKLYQQLSSQRLTIEAREQLVICSDPVCPRLVRRDCSQWLVEMDKKLLSISAHSPVGAASPPCTTQAVPLFHTKSRAQKSGRPVFEVELALDVVARSMDRRQPGSRCFRVSGLFWNRRMAGCRSASRDLCTPLRPIPSFRYSREANDC